MRTASGMTIQRGEIRFKRMRDTSFQKSADGRAARPWHIRGGLAAEKKTFGEYYDQLSFLFETDLLYEGNVKPATALG